jgi:hypothetical protein
MTKIFKPKIMKGPWEGIHAVDGEFMIKQGGRWFDAKRDDVSAICAVPEIMEVVNAVGVYLRTDYRRRKDAQNALYDIEEAYEKLVETHGTEVEG